MTITICAGQLYTLVSLLNSYFILTFYTRRKFAYFILFGADVTDNRAALIMRPFKRLI